MDRIPNRLVVSLVCFTLIALLSACSDAPATPAASSSPTSAPTTGSIGGPAPITPTHPALTPTHQATQHKAGPAILGADISAFVAKYGQPLQGSQPDKGGYTFAVYGGQSDNLDVTTDVTAPDPYKHRVTSLLLNPPGATSWNTSTALSHCLALSPLDAHYEKQWTLSNPDGSALALERLYDSPSLAKQLPASEFVDKNLNTVRPGTFYVILTYDGSNDTGHDMSCATQTGEQS